MSLIKVEAVVLEVLREVVELNGTKWEGLAKTAMPIGDLFGFDSLCSIEASVLIEQKLGITKPICKSSLFISEDGQRALTLQEVSERILKALPTSKEK